MKTSVPPCLYATSCLQDVDDLGDVDVMCVCTNCAVIVREYQFHAALADHLKSVTIVEVIEP